MTARATTRGRDLDPPVLHRVRRVRLAVLFRGSIHDPTSRRGDNKVAVRSYAGGDRDPDAPAAKPASVESCATGPVSRPSTSRSRQATLDEATDPRRCARLSDAVRAVRVPHRVRRRISACRHSCPAMDRPEHGGQALVDSIPRRSEPPHRRAERVGQDLSRLRHAAIAADAER